MSLIEVRELYFSYKESAVLEDINCSIENREMVTIIGPNGGGKTTLLLLLLGLLEPEKGKITINGKKPDEVQQMMGYVPQYSHFDPQFPITVFEVVLMGRLKKRFGFYSRADRSAARDALASVGLLELEQRPFSALSGGQRQRVLIARALVGEPQILLLDEPTANVDAVIGGHLNELLKKLNQKLTILLVTHDMGFVANFTSRVFCINRTLLEHPAQPLEQEQFAHQLYGTKVSAVRHDLNLGACSR